MTPRAVLTDTSLSLAARVLFADLDSRQGTNAYVRVSRQRLADDLGISLGSVKRALAELEAAGLLLSERTGRTNRYTVVNVSRNGRLQQAEEARTKTTRKRKRLTAEPSDGSRVSHLHSKNSLSHNKASTQATENGSGDHGAEAATAAAGDREQSQQRAAEPFLTERFLAALPEHLRPQETQTVAEAVEQSAQRGWNPEALAARIVELIPNPQAGPGLTVNVLRDLSTQPPSEHLHRQEKPLWCGSCDERTRLLETERSDGSPLTCYCPACHPQSERGNGETLATASAPRSATEPSTGSGYVAMIAADLALRKHSASDAAEQAPQPVGVDA